MKILSLFIATFYLLNSNQALANDSSTLISNTRAAIHAVDEYVQKTVTKQHIQGMSLSVLVNGKLLHQKSFGFKNLESTEQVSENTIFPIASITKLYVSTVVYEILHKHDISVDTKIGLLLTDIPNQWQQIKIRDLLAHTSGLVDYYPKNSNPSSTLEALELVSHLPFEFETGTQNQYNQTGFALLHLLIEKLSGTSLEQYLQAHHFNKFSLDSTYYQVPTSNNNDVSEFFSKTWTGIEPYNLTYPPAVYASAGMNTSIKDLTNWITAMINGQVLSPEHLQQVWGPIYLDNGELSDFSLGWRFIDSEKVTMVGHGGADTSEVTHFIHKETGDTVTVIWLSNTLGFYPHKAVNKVASYFMKDIPQCSNLLFWQFNC